MRHPLVVFLGVGRNVLPGFAEEGCCRTRGHVQELGVKDPVQDQRVEAYFRDGIEQVEPVVEVVAVTQRGSQPRCRPRTARRPFVRDGMERRDQRVQPTSAGEPAARGAASPLALAVSALARSRSKPAGWLLAHPQATGQRRPHSPPVSSRSAQRAAGSSTRPRSTRSAPSGASATMCVTVACSYMKRSRIARSSGVISMPRPRRPAFAARARPRSGFAHGPRAKLLDASPSPRRSHPARAPLRWPAGGCTSPCARSGPGRRS